MISLKTRLFSAEISVVFLSKIFLLIKIYSNCESMQHIIKTDLNNDRPK